MAYLQKEIDELEQHISYFETTSPEISSTTIGWQIEHSCLAIFSIVNACKDSKPENFKRNFNIGRVAILTSGWIPRGGGKAPKVVLPPAEISQESLRTSIAKAREVVEKLEALHAKQHFIHPYFGMMHLKQAKRFLQIHTVHHLKIIRDILR